MRAEGRSLAHIARVLDVGASSVARALAKAGEARDRSGKYARGRVFFRDTKPYDVPSSLDELRGPPGGRIELPHYVYWGPEKRVDLNTEGGVVKAYQAVIREGNADDQAAILNRDRLIQLWPLLALPDRVRVLWEGRFPELEAAIPA